MTSPAWRVVPADTGRWFCCVHCLVAVQLPLDTPRPARCQCSPSGFSLLPIKNGKTFRSPNSRPDYDAMAAELEETGLPLAAALRGYFEGE